MLKILCMEVIMKTKLGISAGLFGVAVYFMGLFSGYIVLALFVGYILLFEQNEWLKKSAVKVFVVCVFFDIFSTVIGFIPDIINLINNIYSIFDNSFKILIVSKIVILVQSIIAIVKKAVLLGLGFKALHQGTVKIGAIDRIVSKHMKSE